MITRTCGNCAMCCKLLSIDEISREGVEFRKRAWQWCERCSPGRASSCGVYEERPESCSIFVCGWLAGLGGEEHRPDLCHMVVAVESNDEAGSHVIIYEERPGVAEGTSRGKALLREIAASRIGVFVVISGAHGGRVFFWAYSDPKLGNGYRREPSPVSWAENFADGIDLCDMGENQFTRAEGERDMGLAVQKVLKCEPAPADTENSSHNSE